MIRVVYAAAVLVAPDRSERRPWGEYKARLELEYDIWVARASGRPRL
jgi:hypothetical protein